MVVVAVVFRAAVLMIFMEFSISLKFERETLVSFRSRVSATRKQGHAVAISRSRSTSRTGGSPNCAACTRG